MEENQDKLEDLQATVQMEKIQNAGGCLQIKGIGLP